MLITPFVPTTVNGYGNFAVSSRTFAQTGQEEAAGKTAAAGKSGGTATVAQADLSERETATVVQLQTRDREVRAHEQAHLAAAGGLAVSGATFDYQTGPDGKRYAVGGEVRIDTSSGRDAEETIAKAEKIRAAALAPADPSPQDRSVAAKAGQMAADARSELARTQLEEKSAVPESAAAPGSIDAPAIPKDMNEEWSEERFGYANPVPGGGVNGSGFKSGIFALGAKVDIYA